MCHDGAAKNAGESAGGCVTCVSALRLSGRGPERFRGAQCARDEVNLLGRHRLSRLDTFGRGGPAELSPRTVPVKRRVVNRWWVVGVAAAIAAGACGGGDEGKDQPECEVGTEACPCYRDDTCNDGLECLSDLCVFDPDAPPPSGTGGRRGSGGNSSSPGIGGDGEVPVAGDGPGPGPGGTGSTPSGSGGSDPGPGAGGNSRGGSSNNGGQGNGGTPSNPSGPTPVERYGQLSVQGRNLVDSDGNPVKLEGLSSMWLNWEPTGFALNADALVWMRDNWNLRLFRIAMGAYHEIGRAHV